MKKIDFHIHTIATKSDYDFTFSLEKLKEYINALSLDCIAITNHNLFNRVNFDVIKEECNINVFPGVEVDIENSHILVISSYENIDIFEKECLELEKLASIKNSIRFEEFINIFKNYKKYLIIPHYKKEPAISSALLKKFEEDIFVGEVSSAKKWFSTSKRENDLIPVLFSDVRITEDLKEFPTSNTFVQCEDATLSSIIIALQNRNNISITEGKLENEYVLLPDGTIGSTGLNIVIGKRSSGKTHLLKTIKSSFLSQDVKHIEQFSVVKLAEEEAFNRLIRNQHIIFSNDYLKEMKDTLEYINKIDIPSDLSSITNYLLTLKDFASKSDIQDIYSKCKLFNEQPAMQLDSDEINKLIQSVGNLIENSKYRKTIDKYISLTSLNSMLDDFLAIGRRIDIENEVIKESNKIINKVKDLLSKSSALSPVENFNILSVAENFYAVSLFNDICNKSKLEKTIYESDLYRFKVIAKRKPFLNVSALKKSTQINQVNSEVFSKYNTPYEYVKDLFNLRLQPEQVSKCFFDIEYKTLSNNGNTISGGERAEYVLFSELNDSYKFETVLIDEPESSFDNIFLRDNIRQLIKNLSRKTTVFLVTHNHTLGVLLSPDRIIYTEEKDGDHFVYSGLMSSKLLKTADGKEIGNYTTLIDTMEAGEDAYNERKGIYENLKNN